ncbi:hypothetical protein [Bacillus sp. NMCC46]|uniref:hypothetical protein n=1 Tax=Bacillus sp. NMCC46 TaxID=2108538 RepID=UPI00166FCCF7|nr:hypothetical protein [Bacillus sp. NMCC46]
MKWMISLSLIALLITGLSVYSNTQTDQIAEKGVVGAVIKHEKGIDSRVMI